MCSANHVNVCWLFKILSANTRPPPSGRILGKMGECTTLATLLALKLDSLYSLWSTEYYYCSVQLWPNSPCTWPKISIYNFSMVSVSIFPFFFDSQCSISVFNALILTFLKCYSEFLLFVANLFFGYNFRLILIQLNREKLIKLLTIISKDTKDWSVLKFNIENGWIVPFEYPSNSKDIKWISY